MPFERQIVIDARAHLMGRLASVVAKELLSGKQHTHTHTHKSTNRVKTTRRQHQALRTVHHHVVV